MTVRQPTKRRCSCVLTLKFTFICIYWWTRQRIHNTLIVVHRYLRLMGDKMIPDLAEPHLELFYPPFVTGIDLPHQSVVDSYSLKWAFLKAMCNSVVLYKIDFIPFVTSQILLLQHCGVMYIEKNAAILGSGILMIGLCMCQLNILP